MGKLITTSDDSITRVTHNLSASHIHHTKRWRASGGWKESPVRNWNQGELHVFHLCWHPKLARLRFSGQSGQTGQISHMNRSDRSRQVCQIANRTAPFCRSRWDDRNAYIERPIWSPDEGVMPPGRPAPRSDRSDRSRAVRPVQRPVRPLQNAQSELEVVFWHGIW